MEYRGRYSVRSSLKFSIPQLTSPATIHCSFGKIDLEAYGNRKGLASLDDSCLVTMACLDAVP